MTVDCTDFEIPEPKPWSSFWFSYKHQQSGLTYEVGLCIQTGHVVWAHGPFPSGTLNDLEIFRFKLKKMLPRGERVECDRGYRGERFKIDTPDECFGAHRVLQYRIKELIRARHETLNGRLKVFGCLTQRFRHPIDKHIHFFCAVLSIVQIGIENGHPLFKIKVNYKTIDEKAER